MKADHPRPPRTRQSGFTLIEVMIALVLVAIALVSLVNASGQSAYNAGYLKELTLAQWIAENKAAEYLLKNSFPARGRTEGEVSMADQQWRWQVKVSDTRDRRLRRLDITVIREDGEFEKPLASLVSFVGQPL